MKEGIFALKSNTIVISLNKIKFIKRLIVSEVYDNVDLEYYFDNAGLKYYIIIKPGWSEQSDPISILYEGADEMNILGGGELEIITPLGTLTQHVADAYQIDAMGDLDPLGWDAEYIEIDDFEVGFDIGVYDDEYPLVLEISLGRSAASAGTSETDWATLYGGNTDDVVTDIFVENYNNIFISGFMNSTVYPTTYYVEYDGTDYDAFIQNFTNDYVPNWAIIFGGEASDKGGNGFADSDPSITVNSLGDVFIAGSTSSDEFPTMEYAPVGGSFNVDERSCPVAPSPCREDAYIARFNNAGTLIWSTYLGTTARDDISGITINSNDEIIVVGSADNAGTGFDNYDPGGSSFYDILKGDGAIYSFDNDAVLIWGTQFGGTYGGEIVKDVVLDVEENILIVGETRSEINFPTTVGAFQETYGGGEFDGFAAKFSPTYEPVWITYVGGIGNDQMFSIESDLLGNVYIGGVVWPDGAAVGFPTMTTYGGGSWYSNSFQGGGYDAILGKFEPDGTELLMTYYGTPGWDFITDIASDGDNIYFVGHNWLDEFDYDDLNQIPDFIELADFYFDDAIESERSSFIGSFDETATPRLLTYLGYTALDMANTICISGQRVFVGGEALNYYASDEFLPLQDPGFPAYYQGVFNNTPAAINPINNDGYIFVDTDKEIIYTDVFETEKGSLQIYPNPADGMFFIEADAKILTYEIVNMQGQIIQYKTLADANHIVEVSIPLVANGIYVVKVFTENGIFTEKINLAK